MIYACLTVAFVAALAWDVFRRYSSRYPTLAGQEGRLKDLETKTEDHTKVLANHAQTLGKHDQDLVRVQKTTTALSVGTRGRR